MKKNNLRRSELDIARGLGILAVILGHTVSFPLFRGFIFSFHMPLFFIIGGINYRFSETKEELFRNISKSFKRLIVPSVSAYVAITGIYYIFGKTELHMRNILLAIFYSNGVKFDSCFGTIPAFGAVWFLVCLFWCRTISDLLHYKCRNKGYFPAVVLLTFVGVSIGRFVWLPQNLDIVLAVLFFFYMGMWIDKAGIVECISAKPLVLLGSVIFAGGVIIELYYFNDYLELADRSYPIFPLCFVMAILLSLCVMAAGRYIALGRIRGPANLLSKLGRESLLLFLYIILIAYGLSHGKSRALAGECPSL